MIGTRWIGGLAAVITLVSCAAGPPRTAARADANEAIVRLTDVSPYYEYREYLCKTDGFETSAEARARAFDAAVTVAEKDPGQRIGPAVAQIRAYQVAYGCRAGAARRFGNLAYTFETENPATPTWTLRCRYGSDTTRAEALLTARRAAGFYLAEKAERRNLPDFRDEMEARYRCR